MLQKIIIWFISISLFASSAFLVFAEGNSGTGINTPDFIIDVSTLTPGLSASDSNTTENANTLLGVVIQTLLWALTSISVLIMVVWAGYMILYNGQDELLSKWKSIFISGVIATAIALTSYYLVDLLRNILF